MWDRFSGKKCVCKELFCKKWLFRNASAGIVSNHKTNRKSIWWSGGNSQEHKLCHSSKSFGSALWTGILLTILIQILSVNIETSLLHYANIWHITLKWHSQPETNDIWANDWIVISPQKADIQTLGPGAYLDKITKWLDVPVHSLLSTICYKIDQIGNGIVSETTLCFHRVIVVQKYW